MARPVQSQRVTGVRWIALFLAVAMIGGSYGWLQGVAWLGMAVRDVRQHQSLQQTLKATFNGSSPCALCKAISRNRQKTEDQDKSLELHKQKETLPGHYQVFILPHRPFLAILPETVVESSRVYLKPEIPPPRRVSYSAEPCTGSV